MVNLIQSFDLEIFLRELISQADWWESSKRSKTNNKNRREGERCFSNTGDIQIVFFPNLKGSNLKLNNNFQTEYHCRGRVVEAHPSGSRCTPSIN